MNHPTRNLLIGAFPIHIVEKMKASSTSRWNVSVLSISSFWYVVGGGVHMVLTVVLKLGIMPVQTSSTSQQSAFSFSSWHQRDAKLIAFIVPCDW
jgi:hypothetical protein